MFTFDARNIYDLDSWFTRLTQVTVGLPEEVAREVAALFLERLKSNWYGQTVDLAPLSEEYLRRKERKGLDTRILIATQDLVQRLAVFTLRKPGKTKGTVWAGVKKGTHEPSGLDYVALMKILEYGSGRIPRRPIFMRTRLQLAAELRTMTEQLLREKIQKRLKGGV